MSYEHLSKTKDYRFKPHEIESDDAQVEVTIDVKLHLTAKNWERQRNSIYDQIDAFKHNIERVDNHLEMSVESPRIIREHY